MNNRFKNIKVRIRKFRLTICRNRKYNFVLGVPVKKSKGVILFIINTSIYYARHSFKFVKNINRFFFVPENQRRAAVLTHKCSVQRGIGFHLLLIIYYIINTIDQQTERNSKGTNQKNNQYKFVFNGHSMK